MSIFTPIDGLFEISLGPVLLADILYSALVLVVCLIVMAIIKKIAARALSNSRLDPAVTGFIRAALGAGLWFITLIIVADSLGIPVNSLVALLGVAGLALSLSVQNLLTNLFSGITALATKPFAAGDFVELGGVSGTVRSVGLFTTTLAAPDNRIIIVPNGDITSSKIINYSREPARRVDLRFPVKHSVPSAEIKETLLEVLSADPRVLSEPAPFAALEGFQDGVFVYLIRAWTKNADYWGLYFDLNEAVCAALERRGVSISGKSIEVQMKNA